MRPLLHENASFELLVDWISATKSSRRRVVLLESQHSQFQSIMQKSPVRAAVVHFCGLLKWLQSLQEFMEASELPIVDDLQSMQKTFRQFVKPLAATCDELVSPSRRLDSFLQSPLLSADGQYTQRFKTQLHQSGTGAVGPYVGMLRPLLRVGDGSTFSAFDLSGVSDGDATNISTSSLPAAEYDAALKWAKGAGDSILVSQLHASTLVFHYFQSLASAHMCAKLELETGKKLQDRKVNKNQAFASTTLCSREQALTKFFDTHGDNLLLAMHAGNEMMHLPDMDAVMDLKCLTVSLDKEQHCMQTRFTGPWSRDTLMMCDSIRALAPEWGESENRLLSERSLVDHFIALPQQSYEGIGMLARVPHGCVEQVKSIGGSLDMNLATTAADCGSFEVRTVVYRYVVVSVEREFQRDCASPAECKPGVDALLARVAAKGVQSDLNLRTSLLEAWYPEFLRSCSAVDFV